MQINDFVIVTDNVAVYSIDPGKKTMEQNT
jgi:hypothetical protein